MSKLGVFWDWFLPGLICLDPVGAIAFYSSGAEKESPGLEPASARRRELVPDAVRRAAIIPLAGL
jgi:hypothetical protein